MASLGALTVDLALQSAQFIAGMRQAQAQTNASSKAITSAVSMAKGAFGGLAGVLSVNYLKDQIQAAFDYGDAIVDLSDRTGASTRFIQEFRYAAQLSGSSVESADVALDKFAKNLGSSLGAPTAMGKVLSDLGVKSNKTDVAFRQFTDGVAKLPTVAQRNAAATAVLGKSAGDLTLLLSGGAKGFDSLAQAAEQYGIVIDDRVLRNGGQVNDQLDTMRMILNAQMASQIIQNADALMAFANAAMTAAGSVGQFFQQMDVNRSMSIINADGSLGSFLNADIPKVVSGLVRGKSMSEQQAEEADHLLTTHAGRDALFEKYRSTYNAKISAGTSKDDPEMVEMRRAMQGIAQAEVNARRSLTPPTAPTIRLPTGGAKPSHAKSGPTLKSDAELAQAWSRDYDTSILDQYRQNLALQIEPTDKAALQRSISGIENAGRLRDIDYDTGTDREVAEGKKRLTVAQADQLKEIERATQSFRLQSIDIEESGALAKQRLELTSASLERERDDLTSQEALARSTRDRRDLALKLVANDYEQQRLQLEAIRASETATQAEKEIAKAKLAMLPMLKQRADESARRQNQSPLEAYLDQIPRTAAEINDQLEAVETQGLDALQNGLLDVVHGTQSVGEAFHSMVSGILDGLLKIAMQQAIIKPLGSLLFGSGDDGFGGIFGSLFKAIGGAALGGGGSWYAGPGARANGGYTGAGHYLVGERGPELVSIGANANVTTNAALRSMASNDNGSGGITVRIDSITSNDPVMVRRMVAEGVLAAIPAITQQATDKTFAKLRRGNI